MFKKIFILIAILPICYVIDLLNDSNWTESYISFLKLYWDVILVLFMTVYLFEKNKTYQYAVAEDMRRSQFFHEINRYNGTPYVAPLLLLYLKNPPSSLFPTDYKYVNDTFYRTVVNVFRDRVYILQEITHLEPATRGSYLLEVIGPKRLGLFVFYITAPFMWYYFVTEGLGLSLLNDWPLLTLPFICVSFQRAMSLMKGFISYVPSRLEHNLDENECNMKITWRDTFPDRDIGITFIRAYYFEMEKRQRYEIILQGKKVPQKLPTWMNGNFAPYLYPSDDMPVWENAYMPYYEQKLAEQSVQQLANTPNKNVVQFPTGK